jgi:uncharacterized glyoxalase superfamily protein PhnB/DNA-binding winged helix-turn-helix (wHTH) protein
VGLIYRFEGFELDAARFELRRDHACVDVQPKVLRLLLHLVEHRSRAVATEELLRVLWPDTRVGGGSLKRAVLGARQALGERGEGQTCIRTVRGFGYQFVGAIEELATTSTAIERTPDLLVRAPARSNVREALLGREAVMDLLDESLQQALAGSCRCSPPVICRPEDERMGIRECIPYLHVNGAARAIAFYVEAFGAKENYRLSEPSGRVGHAELDFNGTLVMLADEFPELGFTGPSEGRPTTVTIHLHVDDADEAITRAVAAGARMLREPTTEFYGERSGRVRDPFGHEWSIGHEVEKVSPEEMQRRYTELLSPK